MDFNKEQVDNALDVIEHILQETYGVIMHDDIGWVFPEDIDPNLLVRAKVLCSEYEILLKKFYLKKD